MLAELEFSHPSGGALFETFIAVCRNFDEVHDVLGHRCVCGLVSQVLVELPRAIFAL